MLRLEPTWVWFLSTCSCNCYTPLPLWLLPNITPDTSCWFILFLPQIVISTRNTRETELVRTGDWTFLQQMFYRVVSLLFLIYIYISIDSLSILLTISLTTSSLKYQSIKKKIKSTSVFSLNNSYSSMRNDCLLNKWFTDDDFRKCSSTEFNE